MTTPIEITASGSHSQWPVIAIQMGNPAYSPEQVGWTVKIYTHATSVWTELEDPSGRMRGGTCVDLFYLTPTDEDEDEDEPAANPRRLNQPMFLVDGVDSGDPILFVTIDPEDPSNPLIELNDAQFYAVNPCS